MAVGRSVIREDAVDKVTGKAQFIDDYKVDGQLWGKTLVSPHPHARIISIDTREARALPGVKAVLTWRDVPGKNYVPLIKNDMPILAEEVVRFAGEAVALVAAEDLATAEEARRRIKVVYEELPAVLTIEDSIKPGAIQLHPHGNVHRHYQIRKGDVNVGFAAADIVFEQEYRTGYQEHAYLETQGMLAVPGPGGSMDVHGSMQCPFYIHDALTVALGIPMHKIRVIQATTGGAFGGKEDMPSLVADWAAILAHHTGRPVKLILSREEDFVSMSKRHPSLVRFKTGVTSDGRLVAVEVLYYLDGGAYSTLSPVVMWRGCVHALGPYVCPNVKIDTDAVATNKLPCGAFRGFGTPQILFAHELQMDELAHRLGRDPLEIRRLNSLQPGDETATGHVLNDSMGLQETIRLASEGAEWSDKRKRYRQDQGPVRRGIGISTVFYGVGLGAGGRAISRAGAFVQIHKDGSVSVAVGTTDMGQGMRTVLNQVAAEALGLPYEQVRMLDVDTSRVPDSGPTVASRSTVMSGNAIIDACNTIRQRMAPVAGELLECPVDDLVWKEGVISCRTGKSKNLPLVELVAECMNRHVHLACQGWFSAPYTSFDENTGQGWAYYTYAYATNIAEVEVDLRSGEVKVLRITAAHDVGRAVNPQQVEGQIQGGTLQGVGYALSEEILMRDGRMINPDFSTYIIPAATEAPIIDPIIVEARFGEGPFGAKGFGELPLMGVAPAVANAVFHATGARIRELPLKPERVLDALDELGTVWSFARQKVGSAQK